MDIEHSLVEYKSDIDDKASSRDFKAEVVSFLNSRSGGTILLGVNNDGTSVEFSSTKEKHAKYQEWEEKIANWTTNAFEPDVYGLLFVDPSIEPMVVKISGGLNRPYYYKDGEGFNPKGIYIRVGSTKRRATAEQIKRLMISSVAHLWEQQQSEYSNLTFNYTKGKLAELDIEFNETGLEIRKPGERYNNAALLLSDQNPTVAKVAVFEGTKVDVFLDKKEYAGSLPEQIDKVLDYMKLVIRERNIITGAPQRTVLPDYSSRAVRECILNAYGHRDWTIRSDIRIFVFDDRLEIYSPGGAPDNLTVKQIINGASVKRNPIVIKAMDKLDYIENYNSGVRRILKEYESFPLQPEFFTDDAMFMVTLFNKNYYYDQQRSSSLIDKNGDENGDEDGDEVVGEKLSGKVLDVYKVIVKDPGLSHVAIADTLGISKQTVYRSIKSLKDKSYIEREGSDTKGYWLILK